MDSFLDRNVCIAGVCISGVHNEQTTMFDNHIIIAEYI